ncbi:MAG: two pore domain potassium channel family protein [Armatimonadetes bacterium]|nr:two pore domain potassium channel family protein [Armatimonadota bacterium]
METSSPDAREAARRLVAGFVRDTCREARSGPGQFSLDEAETDALYQRLCRTLDNPTFAAELIDRSLRYIAFYLADCGLHSEAMKASVAIHHYRSRLMRLAGRGSQAWATRVLGLSIGVTWDPIKVVAYSVIAYLAFVAILLGTSCVTSALTGEAAIICDRPGEHEPELAPPVYKHLYFAAVTLTTLGYGDVRPNLRHWWGIFPATVCALGALTGYVILAAIVAVIMNRSGIHPYARIGDWMRQYETDVLGGPIPLFRWDGD